MFSHPNNNNYYKNIDLHCANKHNNRNNNYKRKVKLSRIILIFNYRCLQIMEQTKILANSEVKYNQTMKNKS